MNVWIESVWLQFRERFVDPFYCLICGRRVSGLQGFRLHHRHTNHDWCQSSIPPSPEVRKHENANKGDS